MAVTFLASGGSLATNATTTTLNITSPAVAVGDHFLLACLINKESTVDITPPDGTWTEIVDAFNNAGTALHKHQYAAFYKVALADDGNDVYSFAKDIDDNKLFCGVIATFGGVDTTTPLDATAAGVTATTTDTDNVTFPAFDPAAACHAVFVAFYGNDLTTFAADMSADTNPDCTKRFDLESGTGSDASIAMTSGDNDGSNIASRTWASGSTADAANTGLVFGLKAAAAAAPVTQRLLATLGVGT